MTIYTSRLGDGGIPPLSSPTAGGSIKAMVKLEVGTTTHADNDTIVLAVIPAEHELIDFRLAVDGMGSTTGGANGYLGLIGSANVTTGTWNASSTNGDMSVLQTFNSTTQQSDHVMEMQHTAFMSVSGVDQSVEQRLAIWVDTIHATAASMSDYDVYGWVEYKPILSSENAKKVSGAS